MSAAHLYLRDAATGEMRAASTDDFLSGRALNPVGSLVAITVGTSASTLAALMTAASSSIYASTEVVELKIRDDQASANVVKLAYAGTVTSLLYDAAMSLDPARVDPVALIGQGVKASFDAYSLIATASTVVLVRQYLRATS